MKLNCRCGIRRALAISTKSGQKCDGNQYFGSRNFFGSRSLNHSSAGRATIGGKGAHRQKSVLDTCLKKSSSRHKMFRNASLGVSCQTLCSKPDFSKKKVTTKETPENIKYWFLRLDYVYSTKERFLMITTNQIVKQ